VNVPVHLKRRRDLPAFDAGKLRRRANRLLSLLKHEDSELSILLTQDAEMTELNRTYRGRNRTTDVLAFSQLEGERADLHEQMLGDVVISVPQARRQARQRSSTLMEELVVLLVHGTLHLLGLEHEGAGRRAAAAMRREQDRLVAILEGRQKA
jgi:probable rRNA maturation factor